MEFEWDENKNKLNIEKHSIDFNDAKEVFYDVKRKTSIDLRKDYGEERWITIGSILKIVITVVFTFRGKIIRIISTRIASHKEREMYFNN